jgi:hypothetical protein
VQVVFDAVRFDEMLKVLVGDAVASSQTYCVELSLPYIAVYGQDVDLEDSGHLFRGQQVTIRISLEYHSLALLFYIYVWLYVTWLVLA